MKNIIITSGPTNEKIDAVMKITNMSTGALGAAVADTFLEERNEEIERIYYISTKMSYKPKVKSEKIQFITVESTQNLIEALEELEKERGIKKDVILESIETALVTAYKRNFDSAENVKVVMDDKTGEAHLYAVKEVVEIVEDINLQIN